MAARSVCWNHYHLKYVPHERFVGGNGWVSEIYWMDTRPRVSLAVVSCPRGDDKLRPDLIELKVGGIETVVSMLEPDEAAWMGLADEGRVANEVGMNFMSFPIPDGNVPLDVSMFQGFVADLAARVNAGESIGVHCRGCIGRATLAVACTLVQLGFNSQNALAAVETARGCQVPDTMAQERWILHYRPVL